MGFIKEFKEFALKGNVMDMAVGVIIGGAFGKIVSSLVDDIIMPLVGKVLGNADFTNLYIPLSDKITEGLSLEKARELGSVFAYGQFCQNVIDFLIVALCIFLMIKAMNKLNRKKEEPAPEAPAGPTQEELLTEIRDLLKKK
ncbi:MAG: large conductance mechanosensitive channel protein MscL [Prevotella sp.]|nr:large conductance mechanosensitive channel protein MscL [Prevotella sp.]